MGWTLRKGKGFSCLGTGRKPGRLWGAFPATTPEGHGFPVGPMLNLLETWLCWTPQAWDMALPMPYLYVTESTVCTELH